MKLQFSILGERFSGLENELRHALSQMSEVLWEVEKEIHPGTDFILVNATFEESKRLLKNYSHHSAVVAWIASESEVGSQLKALGIEQFDAVVSLPLRVLDLVQLLRTRKERERANSLRDLNRSLSEIIESLKDDLKVAETLQKKHLPQKFPNVKGFDIHSRYLAGVKAGGAYYDILESEQKDNLLVLMTETSCYGLSSALIRLLMSVGVKADAIHSGSPLQLVRSLHTELAGMLKQKDTLGIFYGTLSRKNHTFDFVNFGNIHFFVQKKGKDFEYHQASDGYVTHSSNFDKKKESRIKLSQGDRLVIVSTGFMENMGGTKKFLHQLGLLEDSDAKDILNLLTYGAKSKITEEEEFLAQDCAAMVIDIRTPQLKVTVKNKAS